MGRVTAPEPHNPPLTRRALREQRERDAERAATAPRGISTSAASAIDAGLAHTKPLPVIDAPAASVPPTRRSLRTGATRARASADSAPRSPSPVRVGARGAAAAPTRRAAKTALLMSPASAPPRHARAPRRGRAGVVAALTVVATLVLGSTATMTAALTGQPLTGVAQGTVAAPEPAPTASVPVVRLSAPERAQVQALPAPTVDAAPAALALCDLPAFADALAAGDDAGAIAAAGGAESFRAAVAGGTAPCVALDDPARVWAVINKSRPNAPLDYRPTAVALPDGVRSIEGGALRTDAATALSQMVAAASAAGVGEIALLSGFRSYETQQTSYANQVDAQGAEGADLASARPGFSEHQSGLAGDVVACADTCGSLDDLAATPQGVWIAQHAWEYGWITRYEDGFTPITGYSPEPWHLRFVGTDLAQAYHEGGWHTLEDFFGLPAAPVYGD
jgi:D-alanyl-D-alanine carboxypeptidase